MNCEKCNKELHETDNTWSLIDTKDDGKLINPLCGKCFDILFEIDGMHNPNEASFGDCFGDANTPWR